MSITWRSFDILFCLICVCVCVCHILYVSWCSWSMSTHGYICEHRECNVIVSFCVFSLSLSFHSQSFLFGCSLLYLFFSSSCLSFTHFVHYLCPVPVLFFLSVLPPYPPSLLCSSLFGSPFPSFLHPSSPVSLLSLLGGGTGKWWTVPSCWMWTTWWRCASQIGSVCIRTCRSSTGVWWRRAWLKPKTPPRVAPNLNLNPWWEGGGKPPKEPYFG